MEVIKDQEYYRQTGRMVFNDTVMKNREIMTATSEGRIKIQKEGMKLSPWDIIEIMSNDIIYPLLGDDPFRIAVERLLEERR